MHALLLLAILGDTPTVPEEPEEVPPSEVQPRANLEAATPAHTGPNEVAFSWWADVTVTAGLGTAWLLSEAVFKKDLAPAQCRWCGQNSVDNTIRSWFVPANSITYDGIKWADTASGVTAYILAPLVALGYDALVAASFKGWLQDFVIILEAVMAGMVTDQIVKFAAGRERPFVSSLTPAEKTMTRDPSDNNLSFYSGHATFSAAFAFGAGTLALIRGYKYPWLVWLVGCTVSAATSLLRMAADKHYFTDVLMGTAMGAVFGVGLPLLFHRAKKLPVEPVVTPGGVALRGKF
jgi:membrane-associated phospholipid phosphatase